MDSKGDCSCRHRRTHQSQAEINEEYFFPSKLSRKRRSKTFCAGLAGLLTVSITALLTDVHTRRAIQVVLDNVHLEGLSGNSDKHCVVHIHGVHHSGTGFTRKIVYDSLGGDDFASMHSNTSASEDEGQHLQDVFPTFDARIPMPQLCGIPNKDINTVAQVYYCPKLQSMANETAKTQLMAEWSRYWNMTKPFLIQKTPTLDLLYLERMKLHRTVHVLVMRHPFAWDSELRHFYLPFIRSPFWHPTVWLDIWTHVLDQLANGNIESFAVVTYETLIRNQAAVSAELAELIRDECGMKASLPQVQSSSRRRLHLHTELDSSQYLVPDVRTVNAYNKCQTNAKCKTLLVDTASVLAELGYKWDPEAPFEPKDDSLLMFSSRSPPPIELVEKMKAARNKMY